MTLATVWFVLIAVLWTGFFVLEGFDFGVGILQGVIGRDEAERRAVINTIGPVWDGNEVWLIVAGAGMFAAFPGWYATLFSAAYLAMVLLLAGLILRGVSFEYRGKGGERWRSTWDRLRTGSSAVIPFLIGVALGGLVHGLPIGADQEFTGSLIDLLSPYALWVGLTVLLLCILHGGTFLTLKTRDDLRVRASRLARRIAPVAALAVLVFVVWTQVEAGRGPLPNLAQVVAVVAALSVIWLVGHSREGWAFTATACALGASVLSLFVALYPRVMLSTTSPSNDLTVDNTASGTYALQVMTVVVAVLLPVVVAYQVWSYHVFRERVRTDDFSAPEKPVVSARRPTDSSATTSTT